MRAVQAAIFLPAAVRAQAATLQSCERKVFDQSYLDFLQEQIDLAPRGPEWAELLSRRLAALAPFCGLPTISGRISTSDAEFFIRVDPRNCRVIHAEEWPTVRDAFTADFQ